MAVEQQSQSDPAGAPPTMTADLAPAPLAPQGHGPHHDDHDHDDHEPAHASIMARPSPVVTWAWFILKNLIGWVLILAAPPLGGVTPGPLGIVSFLIGFSLITFPGKRRLTARALSGKPITPDSRAFQTTVAVLAVTLPVALVFFLRWKQIIPKSGTRSYGTLVGVSYAAVALVFWWAGLKALPLVNYILRFLPKIRRKIRPWLRRKGIDLLPRRRRRRRAHAGGPEHVEPDEEILEIHERHRTRFSTAWSYARPWLHRLVVVSITAAIFFWILEPVVENWPLVKERVLTTKWSRFLLAALMFAVFLFAFRALAWRYILGSFGYWLPVPAAVRIWSASELARYVPGMIWQVVGRVYLVKPYGVRGSHCSASQVLELAIFLLANILVAVTCMLWHGVKKLSGPAEQWIYGAMALVPVLVFLLHPNVLYAIINKIMARLRKPPIVGRMGFDELAGLLFLNVVGLLFQSFAIWLIVSDALGGLQLSKWWVVAGSYCLAWVAGFLAFWAPGGLGVRELVFVAAMELALPPAVRQHIADPMTRAGVLAFLSVLLRLWATTGEFILAGLAYAADYEGAANAPSPPSRVNSLAAPPAMSAARPAGDKGP